MNNFIWVLDGASAGVFKIELPCNFPENGDYEVFLDKALPKDVRITECNWMINDGTISLIKNKLNK